jgi:transcriptional regulator with XRE-family HTH domain
MFKNKIDYWIKEKGLSGKFVAKRCDVVPQTVSSWRKNNSQPSLKEAFILAKLLGVRVDDLGDFEADSE